MKNLTLTKITTWGDQPHFISKKISKYMFSKSSDEHRLIYLGNTNPHPFIKNLLVKA